MFTKFSVLELILIFLGNNFIIYQKFCPYKIREIQVNYEKFRHLKKTILEI
jgi:hypothetical protein